MMEEKYIKITELLEQVSDPLVHRFFDLDSEELLDEKIQVLTALKDGTPPKDIPDYYKVLELMPKDQHWDL
ncbi:MAG: hypothetical protein ACLR1M_11030 [Oscillospiraceae bacterium]